MACKCGKTKKAKTVKKYTVELTKAQLGLTQDAISNTLSIVYTVPGTAKMRTELENTADVFYNAEFPPKKTKPTGDKILDYIATTNQW